MDPNMVKFLEENEEDETMHSGAKGNTSTLQLQQLSDFGTALSQGCGQATSQFPLQSQTSNHDGIVSFQNGQVLMANQSTVGTGMIGQEVSASIEELLSILLPRLDKYRVMQLQSLCSKVKKGKVSEGSFIGHMTSIVGPELIRVAVHKLKACTNSDTALKQNRVLPISGQQHKAQLFSPQMKQGYAAPMNLMDEFWMQSSNIGFTQPTSMPNSLVPSVTSSIGPENNPKAPFKRPLVGQKKPMGAPGSSPPPSSKKRKVSEAFLDQSIGQLNDVTAGINIREEEEQLFSGSKAKDRVSEVSWRVVQEEEERLIFHTVPIHNKVIQIMAKFDLKSKSNDVEQCLSLCVEERMLGLITNLIRLSKQRVDIEKPSHRTIITSDVRQQIMSINCKAQQEWERKQAGTEDSQKLNELESTNGLDDDKVKSESRRVRKAKADKEKDDNLRANIAVRAATGVDDMLSKWKGMIEAKQKQEKNNKSRENQKAEKGGSSASLNTHALVRKGGRNEVVVPRSITMKDVICILEKEPQMSKSTLMYRSYFKDQ